MVLQLRDSPRPYSVTPVQTIVWCLGCCLSLCAGLACDRNTDQIAQTEPNLSAHPSSDGPAQHEHEIAPPNRSTVGEYDGPESGDAQRPESRAQRPNPLPWGDAQAESKSTQRVTGFRPAPRLDDDTLRVARIRRLQGKHLTLYTDHPSRAEIDSLPSAFDQAVPLWCHYFKVPAHRVATWHLTGYLIVDSQRFQDTGLLPDDLPPFPFGYQRGEELWLYDQPSDYYRRHLLLHEGTHGFCAWFLGAVGPQWYAEGMAELLATHRWDNGKLELMYFPTNKQEVPHWGRVKLVKDEVAAKRGMTIAQILHHGIQAQLRNQSYGWCWALATFLEKHPRYQQRFRELAPHVTVGETDFANRFQQQYRADRRELNEEWQLFAMNIEYGYDVPREAVQYAAGSTLPPDGFQGSVAADRGWQSSGLQLQANRAYRITASGRYQVARDPDVWWCEPGGVTIRYWQGRPLGVLLGQLRPDEPAAGLTPLARPQVIGLGRELRPKQSGTLYLRINDSPAELADNAGTLAVRIEMID